MEKILDWITTRNISIALVAVGLGFLVNRFYGYPLFWYEQWRYPWTQGSSPLAADMAKDFDATASHRFRAMQQRVLAEIEEARRAGFKVDGLQAGAEAALALDTPAYRRGAVERLNQIRMAIPHRRPAVVAADASDLGTPPEIATPRARPVKRRRKR